MPPPISLTPVPQAAYAAIPPSPTLRHINQLRFINRHKYMYHQLEVAEAEPTEAEGVEEVEEDSVGNHVEIKIIIVHTSGRRSPTSGTSSDRRTEKLHETL